MFRSKKRLKSLSVAVFLFLAQPMPLAFADDWGDCMGQITTPAGKTEKIATFSCIGVVVNRIINGAFIFAGAAALIYLLIGAFKFVTSGGNEKALQQAKGTMTWAIIGLSVIMLSFAIIYFIQGRFEGLDLLKLNFNME